MKADKVIPERVTRMFDLWNRGYTFNDLTTLYKITPSAISQLFHRYIPDYDGRGEGLKRSQDMRGCLTEEEKLNLIKGCKCGCGGFIDQFILVKGRITKNERIYIQGHRKRNIQSTGNCEKC